MKALIVATLLVISGAVASEEVINTYRTLPNSNIPDYRTTRLVTEGNTTYQTLPGSSVRDYRAPSYVTKGDTTYQTLPGSSVRDFRAPAYVSTKGSK